MYILTINSGSSSIKSKLFENDQEILSILIEKIGEANAVVTTKSNGESHQEECLLTSHDDGFAKMQRVIDGCDAGEIERVAHRVVHGGDIFVAPTLIDDKVVEQIQSISHLAPLHNPSNLLGIGIARQTYPNAKHFAIFDTAFHQSIPSYAYRYAIDKKYYREDKIRRYGFHGSSHSFVAKEFSQITDIAKPNLITIHLGNGASICAIANGESIDTSMGFTPLEGLVMGTRCGDIDPSIALFIAQKYGIGLNEVDGILNKQSGLKGLCGKKDMREIIDASENGDKDASLALDIFCYRIKKYIGAYIAVIGKIDGVIFTGGIGEHSAFIRQKILEDMGHLNLSFNDLNNRQNRTFIHQSGISIAVIPTNEELEMARLITGCIDMNG
jgi:acetate kinase